MQIRAWASRLWLLLVVVFVVGAIVSEPDAVGYLLERVSFTASLAALCCIVCGKGLTILLAQQSLQAFGFRKPFKFIWRAYAIGDISKYLPGGIWGFAGRIAFYRSADIPLRAGSGAVLFETGVIVAISALSGMLLVWWGMWFALLPVLGALVFPFVIHRIWPRLGFAMAGVLTTQQIAAWLLFGFSFAILVGSEHMARTAGIFNVGFAAGTLAIFAPSGIGVRELAIGWFGEGDARDLIEIAVVHRLIWLVTDLLVFLPTLMFRATNRR